MIRNIDQYSPNTKLKYTNLGLLDITKIYQLKLLEFFYKCLILENHNPIIEDFLSEMEWTHSYETRRNTPRLPLNRTEINKRFFITRGIKIWSKIPNDLKSAESLDCFKKLTKKYLLENDIPEV